MKNTRSRHIVMGQEGHLELQSKNVKKINDISTWLDAFITYCSIYVTAHSNCAQECKISIKYVKGTGLEKL